MSEEVAARFVDLSPLVYAVCRMLQEEVHKLGFPPEELRLMGADQASFRLERDPASGDHSLVGEWRDPHGGKVGSLAFHADGSFFAEQDVVRVHPKRPRWFIEAVTAWGRGDQIKAEPRLLPMVS
jgi:hypothetical protein